MRQIHDKPGGGGGGEVQFVILLFSTSCFWKPKNEKIHDGKCVENSLFFVDTMFLLIVSLTEPLQ